MLIFAACTELRLKYTFSYSGLEESKQESKQEKIWTIFPARSRPFPCSWGRKRLFSDVRLKYIDENAVRERAFLSARTPLSSITQVSSDLSLRSSPFISLRSRPVLFVLAFPRYIEPRLAQWCMGKETGNKFDRPR